MPVRVSLVVLALLAAQPCTALSAPPQYRPLLEAAGKKHGISPKLLAEVARRESSFNPKARSPAGAIGLMQFMPETAERFGIDALNPRQAIPAAARYLARLKALFGDMGHALAAYNWGEGNVTRWKRGLAPMPAETRNYVRALTGKALEPRPAKPARRAKPEQRLKKSGRDAFASARPAAAPATLDGCRSRSQASRKVKCAEAKQQQKERFSTCRGRKRDQ